MKISTRQAGEATIVDVVGDIDLYTSPELRKALLDLMRGDSAPHVLVNLQGVKYIDSSGVSALVEALKTSMSRTGRFALFALGPGVREVLALTQLTSVFEIYDNEEQALRRAR